MFIYKNGYYFIVLESLLLSIFAKPKRAIPREKTRSSHNYWLMYTVVFLFVCVICFCYFLFERKTMIWSSDGKNQHVNSLIYFGVWFRELFKNIFVNHTFTVPTYSFGLGYGGDIIQILHYYSFGDPLDLTSIFVPGSKTYILYHILIIVRLYLAGLAFSKLCFYFDRNRSKVTILAGAVVYVFGGFALFASTRHPYFINPMIYLPIIIVGVNKILKKQSPIVYIIGVFLSAVSNFYFFYMIVIFTVLYVFLKLIVTRKERNMKEAVIDLLKLLGYAVFGVVMAAIILLPVVLQVIGDPRGEAGVKVNFFYITEYYKKYLSSFISLGEGNDMWLYIGFTGLAVPSLVTLFSKRGERTLLKITFVALTLFSLLPLASKILNGMSYASNRWLWAYSLILAYIVVDTSEDLLNMSRKKAAWCVGVIAVYLGVCFWTRISFSENVFVQMVIALFVVAAVILTQTGGRENDALIRRRSIILLVAAVVGVGFSAYYGISAENEGHYLDKYSKISQYYTRFRSNEAAVLHKKYDNGEFYRYTGSVLNRNVSLLEKNSSTQFFFSLSNPNIFKFFNELDLNIPMGQIYYGLDERASLNALANVKYFVSDNIRELPSGKLSTRTEKLVPYGFNKKEDYWAFNTNGKLISGNNPEKLKNKKILTKYSVYTNDNFLPFGYTYSSYQTQDSFDKMNSVQKQESLLQSVLLEKDTKSVKKGNPELTSKQIDYKIKANDKKATVLDNKIVTIKKDAKVTLTFDGMENCESYFYIEGLNYKGTNKLDLYSDDKSVDPQDVFDESDWENLPKDQRNWIKIQSENYKEQGKLYIKLRATGGDDPITKKITYHTPYYKYYEGKHDFLVNLNYSQKAKNKITVTLPFRGIYTFKNIKLYCQPMDKFTGQVNALKEDTLQKTDFHKAESSGATNEITGEISLKENKIMLLTIPYSNGWKAYIDGKETKILKANIMFSAIEVGKGNHKIRLTYNTPGLKIGIVMSAVGCAAFIAFVILVIVKRRKKAKHNFSEK